MVEHSNITRTILLQDKDTEVEFNATFSRCTDCTHDYQASRTTMEPINWAAHSGTLDVTSLLDSETLSDLLYEAEGEID